MNTHPAASRRAITAKLNRAQQDKKRSEQYLVAVMTMLGVFVAVGGAPANASNRGVEDALAAHNDLSIFYQALLTTGVARELKENTEYTVFAPTNEAFDVLRPNVYPCFYDTQCRTEVATVLRHHIVPENKSLPRFARWGGDIATIDNNRLEIEEPFIGDYRVDGHRVLDQNASNEFMHERGARVSLYRIDGVIISNQELASFRVQPVTNSSNTVTQKTVTTYSGTPVVYREPGEAQDVTTRTKTVTRTTTTQ